MKNVGLIDVDGHGYPNLALMKIASYYKSKGDNVEWANPLFGEYDIVYASKVFTFTPDFNYCGIMTERIIKGGTGYDISSVLPDVIEQCQPDYSIYPYQFSIQFFSRGCIRKCPFCLVNQKEGRIRPVKPMDLNPNGKWIEVLDNNFFANPEWRSSIEWLIKSKQPVNLHGVDIRIMNEEQAEALNSLKLKHSIKIAWDDPTSDLTEKLKIFITKVKPYKLICYVLVGFNSTRQQDMFRLNTLREIGIAPFVMPYRDFANNVHPDQYQKDLAGWANKRQRFKSFNFEDFKPRKGFKCSEYFNQ